MSGSETSPTRKTPGPLARVYESLHRAGLRVFQFCESGWNLYLGEKNNFFYFLGAIPVLLLFVLLFTGLYMFIYYSVAVDTTYESVRYMTEQAPGGRIVRGVHRYAADLMILFTVLHLTRIFFQGKYRAHRKLAWVTGVIILFLLLISGITGYIMPLDSVSRFVLEKTAHLLASMKVFGATLSRSFSSPFLMSKWIMWVILIIHFLIPLSFVFLIFLHVKRVSRAVLFPPRAFLIAVLAFLFALAIIFPVKMNAPADGGTAAFLERMDWFYLFLARFLTQDSLLYFWIGFVLVFLVLVGIPWFRPRPDINHASLDLSACTGCTLCSRDCPYEAIRMAPRSDGSSYRLQAQVSPDLCSGCGICVGSCDFGGMGLRDSSPQSLVETARAALGPVAGATKGVANERALLFLCSGTGNNLNSGDEKRLEEAGVALFSVPCGGIAGPELIRKASENETSRVFFGLCPGGDCEFREGNLVLEERALGKRKPNFNRLPEELSLEIVHFNPSQKDDFIREMENWKSAKQGVVPAKAAPEEISSRASRKRRVSLITRAIGSRRRAARGLFAASFLGILFALFYLGAVRGSGGLPLDRSFASLRLDFFYRTRYTECSARSIPQEEYKKALEKIERRWKMEQLTEEARARLRKAALESVKHKFCGRAREPLTAVLLIDGRETLRTIFEPQGLRRDGLVYASHRHRIRPGSRRVLLRVKEGRKIDGPGREFQLRMDQKFEGGRVYFIDMDNNKGGLYLRNLRRRK